MDPARAFHGIPKMVENYTVAHQSLSSVLFSLGRDRPLTVKPFALSKQITLGCNTCEARTRAAALLALDLWEAGCITVDHDLHVPY
jgi:hypothetical protein